MVSRKVVVIDGGAAIFVRARSKRERSTPAAGFPLTLECVRGFIVSMVKTLRSGALAEVTGVSPDTIRHYEKIGALTAATRTASGYRVYPESAVERVLVIRRALRIGFTLAELAEVLKARAAGGVPCRRVYRLAEEKLRGVTADIEALKENAEISHPSLGRLGTSDETDG
jgi:DNA-binding transcriptional MerR regulator